MSTPMVVPSPARVVVFRSVDRPHLRLEEDDVFACECEGHGCSDCRGHYLLHGFDGTRGLPVVLEGERRDPAPSAPERGNWTPADPAESAPPRTTA